MTLVECIKDILLMDNCKSWHTATSDTNVRESEIRTTSTAAQDVVVSSS